MSLLVNELKLLTKGHQTNVVAWP